MLVLLACACEAPTARQVSPSRTEAAPLDGLDSDALSRFYVGAAEFSEVESVAEGLGPFFNGSSCGHCHTEGGLGGGGTLRVTRVACLEEGGSLEPPPSGPMLHLFSTRPDVASPSLPRGCNAVVSERRTTNVRGAGLLEAVDDDEIRAEAAAQEGGVAGRVAIIRDLLTGRSRVGRFGWKAPHATLEAFAADAYRTELGITNELFPDEILPGGDAELARSMDPAPDPEAAVGAVAALADFMRFSASPPASRPDEAALDTFRAVGCASCHRESYRTGAGTDVPAGIELRLYSDLLLHDVGTGDGVPQGAATAGEFRTPPLWGLREASLLLHDGSVTSVAAAVMAHAGQAEGARIAYEALADDERGRLLAFLGGL